MHDSHKIRTLLACIDDLTKAVQEMSAEVNIHQADQDLLLYRSRLFYEAVLCMPTSEAVAPTASAAPAVAAENTTVTAASVGSTFTEAIEQSIEAAVEQAITQHQEVELDMTFEAAAEPEATNDEEAEEVVEREVVEREVVEEQEALEKEQVLEEEATEVPIAESAAAAVVAEEAAQPAVTPAEAVVAPVAKAAAQSVAFSLTGIIERSGESHLVMAHLKLKPIDDLKSGIGLNEKFLFIRELFGNDHLAYAEAIDKLNTAPDLGSAEQILATEVLPRHQWDLETEAALSFLHLIFRRFAL